MPRLCSVTEQPSHSSAAVRRTAAVVVAVGAVTVFAASPAEADEIVLEQASSAEIEDHLAELESERGDTADRLASLERRLISAQTVIVDATADYGTADVQLDRVTLAVKAAEDDLGAKMTSLIGFAKEQSASFEQARSAAEESETLQIEIGVAEKTVAGLDERIEQAEDAAEAAAAEAAAEAAETWAASDDSPGSSTGASTPAYSSDAAAAAVAFAHDQLGEPYVFGAAGPDTWDCSGLIQGAYAVSGVAVTHSTNAIWSETTTIGRGDLRPGDLVFYHGVGHVAIYIGGDQVIHAPHTGDVVKISDVDMAGVDGYRRV